MLKGSKSDGKAQKAMQEKRCLMLKTSSQIQVDFFVPLLNFNQIDKNLRKSFSFLAVSGVIGKE